MNTLTKATMAILASSIIATSAFSASHSENDSTHEVYRNYLSSVEALSKTLDEKGIQHDTDVDLEGADTFSKKADIYNKKYEELQNTFNEAHFAN
ncbi:hypothetical protein [Marinomonas algicola]|jgi:3-mercaptopyruvate sulfurtransferase SseA|uniref:hypothetical protein n=1 Tax=Marinomonas algicola TaxID=2773454 RepID=UPI00174AA22D|nr:hypothetical protein [Marinomonas algicola]